MTKRVHTIAKMGDLDSLPSVVDETLKHIFREIGTKVIYDYMEKECCLKREEIAEKPEIFSAGLQRLLGTGAPVVEKMILKNLYSKLGLDLKEKEGCDFSDYLKELRRKIE